MIHIADSPVFRWGVLCGAEPSIRRPRARNFLVVSPEESWKADCRKCVALAVEARLTDRPDVTA